MRSFVLATVLAVVAVPSAAQGVPGRWNVNMDSDFGPVSFVFVFQLDDEGNLVGSMQNDFGSTPIEDGIVDGNEISFKLTLDFGQGPTAFLYKGTVDGDEIRMVSSFEDPPAGVPAVEQPFTAMRAD